MKTKLSKDWMPPENVLSLARSKGMPIEDWLYHLIPEWKLYWLERNVMRCWGATFWNHAKREWEKVDKSRLYRMNGKEHKAIIQASEASSKLISKGRIEPPEIRLKDYQQEMIDNIDKCV